MFFIALIFFVLAFVFLLAKSYDSSKKGTKAHMFRNLSSVCLAISIICLGVGLYQNYAGNSDATPNCNSCQAHKSPMFERKGDKIWMSLK